MEAPILSDVSLWIIMRCELLQKHDRHAGLRQELKKGVWRFQRRKSFQSNGWAFSWFERSGWLSEVSERDVYSQMKKCFLFLTSQTQKQFCVGIFTDRCRIAKFSKAGWSVAEMHTQSFVRFPLQIGAKKTSYFFEMSIKYICEMTAFPFRDVMCKKKSVFSSHIKSFQEA